MSNTNPEIEPISLGHLRKIVNKMRLAPDDTKISFEFLLTATFPTVWHNIQKYGKDCYTRGYLQGKGDLKDEN